MSDEIDTTVPPSGPGCQECLAEGGWWVHLRRCTACGHVGCCDTSPQQHATRHYEDTGHPLIRSFEPGEAWFFDFRSRRTSRGPDLAPPDSRPQDQPVPGPAGSVPADWRDRVHR